MSLEVQEEVLFDLMFDAGLQDRFLRDGVDALAGRGLTDAELDDFRHIRPPALRLDARMRIDMILSQLAVALPVTCALESAVDPALDGLRERVDAPLMRVGSVARPTAFGERLQARIAARPADAGGQRDLARAVLEAELGMARSGAQLRALLIDTGELPDADSDPAPDWTERPLALAPFVTATLLPLPHGELKAALCPVPDRELFRHLLRAPTPPATIPELLAAGEPRFLLARAVVEHASRCDPTVLHQTFELSDGFAPLFRHLEEGASVADLLAELRAVGAPREVLAGVQSGFAQLLQAGMLVLR